MAVQLGSAYGKVELDAKGVKKGTQEATEALTGLEGSMQDAFGFTMGGLATQAIGALIGGMRDLYNETKTLSSGFESQMAIMGTAVDPATASMETLHDAALKIGSDLDLVGVDASQAAVAMTDMFKSGMSVNDVFGDMQGYMAGTTALGGALRGSIDLQAASALDLAQAASLVNSTLDTYGLETSEATRVTDSFVRTADASKAEVTDLAAAHQNAAIAMSSFGYTLEDTNTALALMSQQALKGAEAGTGLRAMLNNMLRPTSAVKSAWDELGVALYDSEGHLRRLPEIIGDMLPALQGLTEERRNELVYTLAGSEGQRVLNILLSQGATGWSEMETAIAGASSAQEIAAARINTLQGAEEAAAGAIDTLKIMIGEQFIPVWTEMAKGVADFATNVGPHVVTIAGGIADALAAVLDVVGAIPPEVVATVGQMTALIAVAGGGYLAFTKLVPVIAALGPVLDTAVAGMQLYAGGASMAQVASLGWSAALGPIAIGLGAVALALVAVNKAIELHKQIEEQTTEVTNAWGKKLDEIAAKSTSAAAVVESYTASQSKVAGIYEESSWVAQQFIDKTAILNARGEDLNRVLVTSASNYEDYRAAAQQVNAAVEEQARRIDEMGETYLDYDTIAEHSVEVVDAMTFAMQRGEIGANDSAEAFDQYSQALALGEKSHTQAAVAAGQLAVAEREAAASAEQNTALYKTLTGALRGYNLGQVETARAEMQLAVQLGQTNQLAVVQNDAISLLTAAHADGTLSLDQYRLAAEQVALVNADTPEGYAQVAEVVANATNNYGMLGGAVADIPGKMAAMSDAAANAALTAEEMSQRAKTAWETFAGNVSSGVGAALEAYKAGNAEMLAEQQSALANMLLGQTDQMLAMGQITQDQAMTMKSAVAEEFGIMVDDAQVTTDALLGMYADWAAGGQTSADQIVTFIQNIGTESETLAAKEEAAIQREITAWDNAKERTGAANDRMAERMESLATQTETGTARMETGLGAAGGAAEAMAGQVAGASDQAVGAIGAITDKINAMPTYKEIEIHYKETGSVPSGGGAGNSSGNNTDSSTNGANPHPNATIPGGGVGTQSAMPGFSAPTATAPTTAGAVSTTAGQSSVQLSMPVTVINDAADVELLARRVVEMIQRRQ